MKNDLPHRFEAMLYILTEDHPLGRKKAQELGKLDPRVKRHTRAWVDDSELCLEVECLLQDGSTIAIKMSYCWWNSETLRGNNYFHDIAEWVLNGNWSAFYAFVQAGFTADLNEHATNEHFEQYD